MIIAAQRQISDNEALGDPRPGSLLSFCLSTWAFPHQHPGPAVGGAPDASCSNGGSSTSTLTMLQLKGLEASSRPARDSTDPHGATSRLRYQKCIDRAPTALAPQNTIHARPVRALDFNDFPAHLLSSGAINGNVWDLKNSSEPYSPGARSSKFKSIADFACSAHYYEELWPTAVGT
ncbi:hypothetical protein M407DRAFT_28238 [Tulasnella calospora MUT 4182]|uniref:Uncharacterized protein n=1 Tax=Tulasnella calospora MUT 4182 TaxID=1051891 RepID=A0A0C3KLE5_9AGAM|nr:hypothetical protein M407DRAFT_28238 [Tulasnella calospora MUT 4182]